MPGLTEVSQALPAECRGAVYVRTAAGNYVIIAGTSTHLYRLNTTNYTWTDISGAAAPYNVPLQDSWTFTRFGDKLIAHNLSDPIQVYDIEAATPFTNLAGSPPKAKYSWVSGDFLILGYLEGTNGQKTVKWSGLNNIEWWTEGEKGSDVQELPEGDEIMGGFADTGGFNVIQRAAMQYFPFSPDSGFTFTRTVLNAKQGTLAPRSIVSIGPGRFFYLSEDGFFGGVNRQPIGAERVDEWFLTQVDQTYLGDVQGSADPYNKIVWWKYRGLNGSFYRLGYDWQLDRWCTTDLQVGEMMSLATPGITWDGLDAFYATIADASEAFDSRLFSGGRPTFATFTPDNKLAWFTGASLQATIDTYEIEFDSVNRTFLRGARVITDAPLSTFSLQDGVKAYHGEATTWSASEVPNRAGLINFRQDGRLHKLRLVINEAAQWSTVTGVNPDPVVTGAQ